jgi:hypothetical protein
MPTRTTAALVAAALTIGGLSRAYATDGAPDIFCQVSDRAGNNSSYIFSFDTKNASTGRSVSGTLAETEFIDKDGNAKFFAPGQRPGWLYIANEQGGGLTFWSSNPGWVIVLGATSNNHGVLGQEAWLYHDQTVIAAGGCIPVPAQAH